MVATISEALQKLALSKEDKDSKSNDGHTLQTDPNIEGAKTKAANKLADDGFPLKVSNAVAFVSIDNGPLRLQPILQKHIERIGAVSYWSEVETRVPEARPSAARIALSRYKVWRRKRGKYYTSS